MKVRHKRLWHDQKYSWHVKEQSDSYYIVVREDVPGIQCLSKSDYEPVPEVAWRDVTAECEVRDNRGETMIFHNDGPHVKNVHCRRDEYSLRKVGMKELHDLWRGQDYPYAFIIEKKEPA